MAQIFDFLDGNISLEQTRTFRAIVDYLSFFGSTSIFSCRSHTSLIHLQFVLYCFYMIGIYLSLKTRYQMSFRSYTLTSREINNSVQVRNIPLQSLNNGMLLLLEVEPNHPVRWR